MAGIEYFGGLVLCDIVHLRLNTLEHLLQLLCLQWDDLVVI